MRTAFVLNKDVLIGDNLKDKVSPDSLKVHPFGGHMYLPKGLEINDQTISDSQFLQELIESKRCRKVSFTTVEVEKEEVVSVDDLEEPVAKKGRRK